MQPPCSQAHCSTRTCIDRHETPPAESSASGSLWFPGFSDHLIQNGIFENIDRVYLSLGDREALTRHELMSQVKTETLKIYEYLKDRVDCIFEENEGNHFKDEDLRVCKGIEYTLK